MCAVDPSIRRPLRFQQRQGRALVLGAPTTSAALTSGEAGMLSQSLQEEASLEEELRQARVEEGQLRERLSS